MENFNYEINSANEGDSLGQLEFSCESNFIGSDDDRFVMEENDNYLRSLEPLSNGQDSNFLNPINDILCDISDYKIYCGGNDVPICAETAQNIIPVTLNAANSTWTLSDAPSCTGASADAVTQGNNDSGFFNISTGSNNQLILPANTIEYANEDCSFLSGEYASSITIPYQEHEQHQFSFMPAPTNSIQQTPTVIHGYSDAFLDTIGSLPASTIATAIPVDDRQIEHQPVSPEERKLIIDTQCSPENDTYRSQADIENFAPISEYTPQLMPINNYVPQYYKEDNIISQNSAVKYDLPYLQEFTILQQTSSQQNQQHKFKHLVSQNQCSQMVTTLPICGTVSNQNLVSQKLLPPDFTILPQTKTPQTQQQKFKDLQCPPMVTTLPICGAVSNQNVFLQKPLPPDFTIVPQTTQMHKLKPLLNQNQCPQMVTTVPICGTVSNQKLCSQKPLPAPSARTITQRRVSVLPVNSSNNWTAVIPRQHFSQFAEIEIMRPLSTRQIVPPQKPPTPTNTIDLAEYFDTSSISIPVIQDRPRIEAKSENRRKQKLHIIPGAENFVFEVQKNERQHSGVNAGVVGNWNSKQDPYPEIELPELKEIFKRKKRNNVPTTGSKRTNLGAQVAGLEQTQGFDENDTNEYPINETSVSFDEKISFCISITQGRSNVPKHIQDSSSSDSDSTKREEEIARVAKSFKCAKCMKLFKTSRSLVIHRKRCTSKSKKPIPITDNDPLNNIPLSNFVPTKLLKPQKCEDTDNLSDAHTKENEICDDSKKIKLSDSAGKIKARPLTRSQTRLTSVSVCSESSGSKRSKGTRSKNSLS